jgi:hypothetical protein
MSEWTMGDATDRNNEARDIADACGWRVDEYDDEDRVSLLDAADTIIDLRRQLASAVEQLEKSQRALGEANAELGWLRPALEEKP